MRRGLARWVTGARLGDVEVLHPRPVRRHEAGPEDFAARLRGAVVTDVVRRGKFCWLELDSGEALLAHLGMSGQVLLRPPDAERERHLRVRLALDGGALDPARGGSCGSSTSGCSGASRSCRSCPPRTAAPAAGAVRHRRTPTPTDRRVDAVRALAAAAGRAHRPGSARPDPRRARSRRPLAAAPDRRQEGAARPDADLRRGQHLRGRGAVAGEAALRPPHRGHDGAGGAPAARGGP